MHSLDHKQPKRNNKKDKNIVNLLIILIYCSTFTKLSDFRTNYSPCYSWYYEGIKSFSGVENDPQSFSRPMRCKAGQNQIRISSWVKQSSISANGIYSAIFSYHDTIRIMVENSNGVESLVVWKDEEGIIHRLRLLGTRRKIISDKNEMSSKKFQVIFN